MPKLTKQRAQDTKRVVDFLHEDHALLRGSLIHVVDDVLAKKKNILTLAKKYPTPFYLFDTQAANAAIDQFKKTFTAEIPGLHIFYAMKSNPCEPLLKTVVKRGLGLDASSGRELVAALKHNPASIIFTGPAKTDDELALAIKYRHRLIINIDSFTELRRLGKMLHGQKKTIQAGVRITTAQHSTWNKFGIPLTELKAFMRAVKKYPQIQLVGLQCHMSWNKGVEPYQKMIKEIADYLAEVSPAERARIKFIDIGGGFETYRLEGYYPWTDPQGAVLKTAAAHFDREPRFTDKYFLSDTVPLETYAKGIARAIHDHLDPIIDCAYYCEPGRVISAPALTLVLKVMDVKQKNIVIVDAGTNMIGYELFEEYYYPMINLTRPSRTEIPCRFYGSLCTPDDIFGYYCYAQSVKEGDVVVIPNQGAYTYTFAQNFIKGIPEVRVLQ